jgi:acetoin utilization deacetylase AcuC-like enzyme
MTTPPISKLTQAHWRIETVASINLFTNDLQLCGANLMKVFFREEQSARNADAFSPSAYKPTLVIKDWLRHNLISAEDIMSFEPVTRDDLVLAHEPGFVDGVLSGADANGFGNRDRAVASSLPYTTGSMLAAARYALIHQVNTCSPTSGFHHACYGHANGFCTFNGLMVTAIKLLSEGSVRSIGILDCDVHYGDGTDDIISQLNVTQVKHHTMGERFRSRRDVGPRGKAFDQWLETAVADCRDVDLLLYQAGADPHLDDPLGGVQSTQEMLARDRYVFDAFRNRALVWNLAGGYQTDADGGIEPVLALHRNTARAATSMSELPNKMQPPNLR